LETYPIQRIAIVISELRAGGAERVVVHLASALTKTGKEVLVVCLQRLGELAGELSHKNISCIAIEFLQLRPQGDFPTAMRYSWFSSARN